MNAKNFDRWVLVITVLVFAGISVFGMYTNNAQIIDFGKYGFTGAWSALLVLLNRELGAGNGSGSSLKNGSGSENPTK
jgi:hypothetical protein